MMKSFFAVLAAIAFLWTPMGRTAEPATVTGKWHFVLDTPGGDREVDSIFEQNADKVTGKWGVSDGENDPVAGAFAEKKLTLEFTLNSPEAGPGTMKIKGQLADDGSLTGDWAFQEYSGTFKATRVKAETANRTVSRRVRSGGRLGPGEFHRQAEGPSHDLHGGRQC
jgi:hypothetical protein